MRLDDGRVLPAFLSQALKGENLTVFGDGSQTRSFCYVDDLVDGIYRLLLSDYHLPVNIGNPAEITIKQFGEEIAKLTGVEFKPTYQAAGSLRLATLEAELAPSQLRFLRNACLSRAAPASVFANRRCQHRLPVRVRNSGAAAALRRAARVLDIQHARQYFAGPPRPPGHRARAAGRGRPHHRYAGIGGRTRRARCSWHWLRSPSRRKIISAIIKPLKPTGGHSRRRVSKPIIPFFSSEAMHAAVRAEALAALTRVYDSNWYVLGEEVAQFEQEYSQFSGVAHTVGVGNGLEALTLALRTLGIGPGDEVLVPSNTYIATWLAVTHAGATPVP
nr:UDP-glucuronic acid decarboxylase 6-like [Tanacetum cinerariifolium]